MPQRADALYLKRLRATVFAAFDYGLSALAWVEADLPEVPVPLLAQARLVARSGVGIDTVIRRYVGGYAAFTETFLQETDESGLSAQAVQELMGRQTQALDHLISAVAGEDAQKVRDRPNGGETQRLKLIALARWTITSGKVKGERRTTDV